MIPESVNYHFTRVCNLSCRYCFHTPLNQNRLDIGSAIRGLKLLQKAGMRKINFSGGEPFIYSNKFLGPLLKFSKRELGLESVSVVTNGTLVTDKWIEDYAQHLDIFALSCDSFVERNNLLIGRSSIDYLHLAKSLKQALHKYNVKFKINTVVSSANYQEDMNQQILELSPFRWKCLQILPLKGENVGHKALCDSAPFIITEGQFMEFAKRHSSHDCLVFESNRMMRDSYLILDEEMRFLNCTDNSKVPGPSILDVGVDKALQNAGYNSNLFELRGGRYDWGK